MKFINEIAVSMGVCQSFWREVESSYRIERMYEDYENILISLEDKSSKVQFIHYRNRKGKSVAVLDEEENFIGVLWKSDKGRIGASAEGEQGKRKIIQCLTMLEKSLATGYIEMEVIRNDVPGSIVPPLSEVEEDIIQLLKIGKSLPDIQEELSLSFWDTKKIRKAFIRKGIIQESLEEIAECEEIA